MVAAARCREGPRRRQVPRHCARRSRPGRNYQPAGRTPADVFLRSTVPGARATPPRSAGPRPAKAPLPALLAATVGPAAAQAGRQVLRPAVPAGPRPWQPENALAAETRRKVPVQPAQSAQATAGPGGARLGAERQPRRLLSGGAGRRPAGTAALLLLRLLGLLARPPHAGHTRHAGHPAAAHHLAHHLLAFEEPDYQVADLTDGDAGSGRDPGPPGPVDNLRVLPLGRGHRVHDGRGPVQVL